MNIKIPGHIAVIMDGNGRWAEARGLPRIAGHRAGVQAVRAVVEECARQGVKFLTLFAFSRENWRRPREEVGGLMTLLDQFLKRELNTLMKNNIRLKTIGRTGDIPENVKHTLDRVLTESAGNDGTTLILALSYSGRQDILEAARRFAREVQNSGGGIDDLDEDSFGAFMATSGIPDPDLLIRTSGEKRISNFMLWQIAYTEMYITDKLWPDFSREDLMAAIEEFSRRERRFGMTSGQVKGLK